MQNHQNQSIQPAINGQKLNLSSQSEQFSKNFNPQQPCLQKLKQIQNQSQGVNTKTKIDLKSLFQILAKQFLPFSLKVASKYNIIQTNDQKNQKEFINDPICSIHSSIDSKKLQPIQQKNDQQIICEKLYNQLLSIIKQNHKNYQIKQIKSSFSSYQKIKQIFSSVSNDFVNKQQYQKQIEIHQANASKTIKEKDQKIDQLQKIKIKFQKQQQNFDQKLKKLNETHLKQSKIKQCQYNLKLKDYVEQLKNQKALYQSLLNKKNSLESQQNQKSKQKIISITNQSQKILNVISKCIKDKTQQFIKLKLIEDPKIKIQNLNKQTLNSIFEQIQKSLKRQKCQKKTTLSESQLITTKENKIKFPQSQIVIKEAQKKKLLNHIENTYKSQNGIQLQLISKFISSSINQSNQNLSLLLQQKQEILILFQNINCTTFGWYGSNKTAYSNKDYSNIFKFDNNREDIIDFYKPKQSPKVSSSNQKINYGLISQGDKIKIGKQDLVLNIKNLELNFNLGQSYSTFKINSFYITGINTHNFLSLCQIYSIKFVNKKQLSYQDLNLKLSQQKKKQTLSYQLPLNNNILKNQRQEFNKKIQQLKETIKNLQQSKGLFNQQKRALQQKLYQKEKNNLTIQELIKKHQSQIKENQNKIKYNDLQNLNEKSRLKNQIQILKNEKIAFQEKIDEKLNQKVQHLQKIDSLQKTLKDNQQQYQNLLIQLQNSQQKNNEMINQFNLKFKMFNNELNQSTKIIQEKDKQIQKLQKDLNSSNQKFQQLIKKKQIQDSQNYRNILQFKNLLEQRETTIAMLEQKFNQNKNTLQVFFNQDILFKEKAIKQFIVNTLQKQLNKKIIKTRNIYRYDFFKRNQKNSINVHRFIDTYPNIFLLVRTENGKLIGVFSEDRFQEGVKATGKGILMALKNSQQGKSKYFVSKQGFPPITYDTSVIFGNSDLKIFSNNPKITINTNQVNTYFQSNRVSPDQFLSMGSKREGMMDTYQFYSIQFEDKEQQMREI